MSTTTDNRNSLDLRQEVTAEAARILTAPSRRKAALVYLAQRGIDANVLPEDWPLGYAPPGWTRLTDELRERGFTDQILLDAGLARRCGRGTLIDIFRDRVLFPVHDRAGRVAGFIGRDLSGAPAAPKYLNSPQSALYSKGELLYGLHEATLAARPAIRPVLVEGPLDVLALTARARRSGDTDLMPLASCGTAVTPIQAKLIATVAPADVPVIVAMDGDTAGRNAALAAGEQLRRYGLDVRVAVLPNGCDPAEYVADPDRSLNVFRQSNALPLLTVQLQRCIDAQGDHMQWVEGKLGAARGIATVLAGYRPEDAIKQTPWISSVLEIAPSTFLATLRTAYAATHALPSAGTRAGDLLRGVRPQTPDVGRIATRLDLAPAPDAASASL